MSIKKKEIVYIFFDLSTTGKISIGEMQKTNWKIEKQNYNLKTKSEKTTG